jgi:hypothetical protein
MNSAINPSTRILNKLVLTGFILLTFVQVIFHSQHYSTSLDSWNNLLTITGFIFSVPRVFPGIVEKPFYGLFSILLRVRLWVPVTLCILLAASLGLDLLLPNPSTGQVFPASGSGTGQPSPGLSPGIRLTSVSISNTGQSASSPDFASQTPIPTLSSSGTPVINNPMASPVATDPWDVISQPNVKCSFANGAYDIKISPQQINICKTKAPDTNLNNFIYEITMTMVQGSGNAGIVFHDESTSSASTDLTQQPPLTDLLLFDQKGNYSLAVMSNNKVPMTKTGQCSSFLSGLNKPNQIDVQVIGQTIDVFVNGTYLTSTQDDQLNSGQMGVVLMAGDTITEATYSNFAVWKL